MRTALDPSVAAKLARICALFSSDVSGERGAAAWQADKPLKAADLARCRRITIRQSAALAGILRQLRRNGAA